MIAEEFRVDGKVAIVTGASRGIGKAIALTLAEAGADVALIARNEKRLRQAGEDIRRLGRQALAIPTDVTQEDQVRRAVEQIIAQFGRIDILCNNAGIAMAKPVVPIPGTKLPVWEEGESGDSAEALTLEDWHRVINTDLTSAFLFAQAVGPHMIKQKKGKIINTSSPSAEQGQAYFSAYCASKAGLSALTRCLATEWAPFNINVNAIAPGMTETDMVAPFVNNPEEMKASLAKIPLGRLAQPREMALLVLFLASEASDYLTGQIITLDGGAMARGPGI